MFPALFRTPGRLLRACQRFNQSRNVTTAKVIPYKQELPPVGGYAPYDWNRIPQPPFMSANKQFLLCAVVIWVGYYLMLKQLNLYRMEKLEILDAKVALQPLLMAERDRLYLRRIRRNYEAEVELMKDVPGWEVGKWYDVPVYKTVPPNMWIDPIKSGYWEHSDSFEYEKWYHWWWED